MSGWRPLSIRVSLTLCYVGAMLVILGVYAGVVFAFVSRSVSATLDQRLRGDFWLTSAMVDEGPDGQIIGFEPDQGGGDEEGSDEAGPWLQVWSPEGALLYANSVAQRIPLATSRALALKPDDRIESLAAPGTSFRVLSRHGRISNQPVVIQVARSEMPMRQERRQLALILVSGCRSGSRSPASAATRSRVWPWPP